MECAISLVYIRGGQLDLREAPCGCNLSKGYALINKIYYNVDFLFLFIQINRLISVGYKSFL